MTPNPTVTDERQLVMRWIEAFNGRDLDGMLGCMSPDITFQPLRLHGIERTYEGHDGIARWRERLVRLELDYEIRIDSLSMPAEGTVLATGELRLEGLDGPTPFWAVHSVEHGLITAARHYLSDAELAERFAVR